MRGTCRRGRYVDLGIELQIVPNSGSRASEPSEDLLLNELLSVYHLVRARARALSPPGLNIPDSIARRSCMGFSLPTAMPESTQ